MCSLSACAEPRFGGQDSEIITKLFHTDYKQENGVYSIWLNINGTWKNIVIDDFFPIRRGNWVGKLNSVNGILFGCRNEGNELWAMLLEKAYAKAYGSFMTIEGKGGSPKDALRDLTGAPTVI